MDTIIQKWPLATLFDKKFIKEKCIKKIVPVEKLYSRKNELYKIKCVFSEGDEDKSRYLVFKSYKGEEKEKRNKKEYLMLKALKKYKGKFSINVPEIFYRSKDFLITEFIKGDNLLDYILAEELKNTGIGFDRLNPLADSTKIINNFYHVSREINGYYCVLNDVNLRNFIMSPALHRVDFEDWDRGCPEEDFGKFIAFLLTYRPAFSDWKIKRAGELIKFIYSSFYIDRDRLWIEINTELQSMIKRRNLLI